MNLINRLINKKNDDYYTLSKDTSILSDEPIENDKPDKFNVFTKFMLIITLLLLLAFAFCSIVIVVYDNQMVPVVVITWLLLITLVVIIGM